MNKKIVINTIIEDEVIDNIVASEVRPIILQAQRDARIVLMNIDGKPATDIKGKRDDDDLLIMSKDDRLLLRIEDYYNQDAGISTWVDGRHADYQFTDILSGEALPLLADGQPSVLVYEMIEDSAASIGWGTVSAMSAGLALAGAVVHGAQLRSSDDVSGFDSSTEPAIAIVVDPTNNIPISENSTISTVEDQQKLGKLAMATDLDGDNLTYAISSQANNGTVTVKADGLYTYIPKADFHGTDTFSYTVDDGNGGTITKTATVTVIEDTSVVAPSTHLSSYSLDDGNGATFDLIHPLLVNDNSYYHYDVDSDIRQYDKVNHDTLDSLLNLGKNTTDSSRSRHLDGVTIELPSIDELLDIYNDSSVAKLSNDNWSKGMHWSATEGKAADTHKALDFATGSILEMTDTEMAMVVYQVIL